MLIERGIPIIIQTGLAAPTKLRARYPGITVLAKPVKSELLLVRLMTLLGGGRGESGEGERASRIALTTMRRTSHDARMRAVDLAAAGRPDAGEARAAG